MGALRDRARLLAQIREFFAARQVWEVETPLLASATATDPHIESLRSRLSRHGGLREWFLQTSPEYAMKRLLAAGSGPIFQICKAFRDGEEGRLHNPEFTILEWYRPGFDHHGLMDEVDELLRTLLRTAPARRLTYGGLFEHHLGLDPHRAGNRELRAIAEAHGLAVSGLAEDRDAWLGLLLSHLIEPRLGREEPLFVYDFPASQAALARIRPGEPPVAERFEVYYRGVELANGFHELTDAGEQRRRCESDLVTRRRLGLPPVPLDQRFLAALEAGLPASAGVAMGVDRLAMLRLGADNLQSTLAFPAIIA